MKLLPPSGSLNVSMHLVLLTLALVASVFFLYREIRRAEYDILEAVALAGETRAVTFQTRPEPTVRLVPAPPPPKCPCPSGATCVELCSEAGCPCPPPGSEPAAEPQAQSEPPQAGEPSEPQAESQTEPSVAGTEDDAFDPDAPLAKGPPGAKGAAKRPRKGPAA